MDYEFLRFIWWLLVGVLLIGFAVTDFSVITIFELLLYGITSCYPDYKEDV